MMIFHLIGHQRRGDTTTRDQLANSISTNVIIVFSILNSLARVQTITESTRKETANLSRTPRSDIRIPNMAI